MKHVAKLLVAFLITGSLFAQQQVQPVAGVLTLNLVPGTTSFKVIIAANITSVVILNPTPGSIISVIFTENATGGFTVAFGGNISSSSCNINTAVNATTTCQFQYDSTSNTWNGIGTVGTLPNGPLPAATSGPGPVFNVKNYGAKGDAINSYNCTQSAGTNMNCSDVTFTAADVGKHISCTASNQTIFENGAQTITAFVDAHNVTISQSQGNFSGLRCLYGTPDDSAVIMATSAAVASIFAPAGGGLGTLLRSTAAPTLYFPTGSYSLYNTGISIVNNGTGNSGFYIKGDGVDQTKIFWHAGTVNNSGGAGISCSNVSFLYLQDLTLDGSGETQAFSNAALYPNCGNVVIRNVKVQNFNSTFPAVVFVTAPFAENFTVVNNAGNGIVDQGGGEFYGSLSSNNNGANGNIFVQNVFGMPLGTGFRWVNGLVDECSNAGNTPPCVQVQNSTDTHFIGSAIFTGMSVDGTSHVNLEGGSMGPFNTDANLTGLTIAAHGMVTASNERFISSGTGKCVNNSGILRDNGANSCEAMFLISSGTSTGTTAVLTATLSGVNTNCAVGDALEVQGATIAGYNGYYPAGATSGVTAVTATTLTYTTAGSNLGALGASGYFMCRNLLTYSGNLPVALLNNPIPNTCYLTITPITNATTFNLCNWGAGTATNITRITASSQVVTTCATAPIITISNGTVSQTLTLTSGKQFWDSFNAQDASTGVGTTIFKPSISATGTDRITIKYDVAAVSACATPPTNLGVTYTIAPIFSN